MPERLPLTDDDLRHYMSLDGFTLERIAQLYGMTVSKVEKQWARMEREQAQELARKERLLQRAMTGRPMPPDWLCEDLTPQEAAQPPLVPAHDLMAWSRETFIEEDGLLCNPDHSHLSLATMGILWTGVGLKRQMRIVAGQMCIPQAQGDGWARARHDWLMCHWFGLVPDFLMMLSGGFCAQADDATFCALVEHELYHAGQARDIFDCPRFSREGKPLFALRGHGCEEHPEVVARYGVGASASGVAALVAAAQRTPSVAAASIAEACGTCMK